MSDRTPTLSPETVAQELERQAEALFAIPPSRSRKAWANAEPKAEALREAAEHFRGLDGGSLPERRETPSLVLGDEDRAKLEEIAEALDVMAHANEIRGKEIAIAGNQREAAAFLRNLASQEHRGEETTTDGLPPELAKALRDPSIIVDADRKAVLADGKTLAQHLNEWRDAPSNTFSADPLPQPSTGEAARLRERLEGARWTAYEILQEREAIEGVVRKAITEFEERAAGCRQVGSDPEPFVFAASYLSSVFDASFPAPSDSQGGQEEKPLWIAPRPSETYMPAVKHSAPTQSQGGQEQCKRCGGSKRLTETRRAPVTEEKFEADLGPCPDCDPASTPGEGFEDTNLGKLSSAQYPGLESEQTRRGEGGDEEDWPEKWTIHKHPVLGTYVRGPDTDGEIEVRRYVPAPQALPAAVPSEPSVLEPWVRTQVEALLNISTHGALTENERHMIDHARVALLQAPKDLKQSIVQEGYKQLEDAEREKAAALKGGEAK